VASHVAYDHLRLGLAGCIAGRLPLCPKKWTRRAKRENSNLLLFFYERQDADGTYCYSSTGECLLARYFRERGFNRVIMAAEFFYHWPRSNSLYEVMLLPRQFNDVAKGKVRTFGAALSRARELELADAD
jgi:hypothetical protein